MGNALSQITTGKITLPPLILAYGSDGIGKSTFASEAPKPIFIEAEQGTYNLDVARFQVPKTFNDVMGYIKELSEEKHDFETLVIDTLDWLEFILFDQIKKSYGAKSIESAAGGYGKGYKEGLETFRDSFIPALNFLREKRNMSIVLLAHSKVTEFVDPSTETNYNRYELKLHSGKNTDINALFREYVDVLLFFNRETFSKGEGKESRGISTDQVFAHTKKTAAWDAKTRFNSMPEKIEMKIGSMWSAVTTHMVSEHFMGRSAELQDQYLTLADLIKDKDLKEKILLQYHSNLDNDEWLINGINRLKELTQEG